jgi:serine/threonine-protein kinase RsbW
MNLRILPGEPPVPATCLHDRAWPSRLDLKQQAMDEVADLLIAGRLVAAEDRHWIYLCLDEAVVNAMLHGNEGDPQLEIRIGVYTDEQRWVVLVSDQGDGFSSDCIPDQSQPESLMLEHGRGIRIMQEWLDELVYYRSGRCAWMSRRRADRSHT